MLKRTVPWRYLNQLDGNLSRLIKNLRRDILEVLAQVEVNIDYPEYDDVETRTTKLLLEKAKEVKASIQQLLKTAKQGKVLRDGLATAIVGRPNVGKSSLLNELLHEDKAIVTDVAGPLVTWLKNTLMSVAYRWSWSIQPGFIIRMIRLKKLVWNAL